MPAPKHLADLAALFPRYEAIDRVTADITGRHGGLVALWPVGKSVDNSGVQWLCACDCGELCIRSQQSAVVVGKCPECAKGSVSRWHENRSRVSRFEADGLWDPDETGDLVREIRADLEDENGPTPEPIPSVVIEAGWPFGADDQLRKVP